MYVQNIKFNHFKVISLNLLLITGLFYGFNQFFLVQCSENVTNQIVNLDSWQFYGIVGYFALSFVLVVFMRGTIVNVWEFIGRVLTSFSSSLIGAAILLYLVFGFPVFQTIYSAF